MALNGGNNMARSFRSWWSPTLMLRFNIIQKQHVIGKKKKKKMKYIV